MEPNLNKNLNLTGQAFDPLTGLPSLNPMGKEGQSNFGLNFPSSQFLPPPDFMNFAAPNSLMKIQELLKREGTCHICKRRRVIYGCFKDYNPTPCQKVYCASCLEEVFHEKILDIVMRANTWSCPSKRKICPCKQCTGGPGTEKMGIEDKPLDVSSLSGSKYQQTLNKQMSQNKLKNLLDFNAQLMMKFYKNIDSLNQDEIKFYLTLIYDNLEKLSAAVNFSSSL